MIYASFLKRLIALIIDTLILSVLCFILGLIFETKVTALLPLTLNISITHDSDSLGGELNFGGEPIIGMIFGFTNGIPIGAIFTWLYYALAESSPKQATPGKILMGIKVTDLQGDKISFLKASIRFWLKILSFFTILIGYIMAAYTKKKQTLHDKISKCLVIKSSSDNIIGNERETNTNWWSKNGKLFIYTVIIGSIILPITYVFIELRVKTLYEKASSHIELGQYQAAIENLNHAIRFNPTHAVIYNDRAYAYFEIGEYDKAIKDINHAIRLDPNYTKAYRNRGNFYFDLGNYQAAIENFNQAIELNPNHPLAYYYRGNVYSDLEKYQAAIEDYNQAIELNPNDADYYDYRGHAYFKLGEYQKAIEDLKQVIRLKPNYALAYYNRGIAYEELGNKQKAINNFQKAADLYQKEGDTKLYEESLDKIRELQQ